MAVERLQKILSNAGVASRREAEELILAGRVAVNGTPQHELGARADLDVDEVTVDGVPVVRDRYRYFMLNKPVGIITTADDDRGRETVLDLVPIGDIQLHPVGRLDMDSEGLLLLTNDGHLTDLLTHPRYEVEKEYLVGLDAPLSRSDMYRIVRGIESGGDRLRAVSAQQVLAPEPAPGEDPPAAPAWALLVLREGKNREIRRMMEALERQVLLLRRIRLGPLHLRDLGPGAFRELTAQEVSALYNAAKQAEARAAAQRDVAPSPAAGGFAPRPALGRKPAGQPDARGRLAPARPPKPSGVAGRSSPPPARRDKPASPDRPGAAGGPQRGAFGGRKSAFAGPPAGGDGPQRPGKPAAGPSRPGKPAARPGGPGASAAGRPGKPAPRAPGPGAPDTPRPGKPARASGPGAAGPSRPGKPGARPGRPGASNTARRGGPPPRGAGRPGPPRDGRGPRRGGPRA